MSTTEPDWHKLAARLAEELDTTGAVTSPAVKRAFAETPRHVFVPRFHEAGHWVDATDPTWLPRIYSDDVLATQHKPVQGQPDTVRLVTSSSTKPSLIAEMLELLDLAPGMTVYESGTGTGYNAAILCHLLGDHAVTTADIDLDLVDDAKRNLRQIGYGPRVLVTATITRTTKRCTTE